MGPFPGLTWGAVGSVKPVRSSAAQSFLGMPRSAKLVAGTASTSEALFAGAGAESAGGGGAAEPAAWD